GQYALPVLSVTPDASAMALVQYQTSFGVYAGSADHPDDAKQVTPTGFVGERLRWLGNDKLIYNRDHSKMIVSDVGGNQAQQISDKYFFPVSCGKYVVYASADRAIHRADFDGKNSTTLIPDAQFAAISCPATG